MSTVIVKRILILFALLKVTLATVEPGDPCTTPSMDPGTCTLFKQCQFLYDKTKQNPLSREAETLIGNSICKRSGRKIFVCCPVVPQTEIQTEAPVEFPIALEENSVCWTPDNKEGSCQRFVSCKPMYKKFMENPDDVNLKEFIQQSVCFKKMRALYVCCSNDDMKPELDTTTQPPHVEPEKVDEEETVLDWLKELRRKVPKAPICGSDSQDRIIGGEVADITDFPWTVLLEYENVSSHEMTFNCGGSLINDRYVLTAAHCVEYRGMEELKLTNVVLGEWDLLTDEDCNFHKTCSGPVVTNEVVKTIVHHNYRIAALNKHDDIALLLLADPVKFTDFVSPICLPLDPSQWKREYRGHKFSAAGFGKTESNSTSTKKLKAEFPFRSFRECKRLYRQNSIILSVDQHICAGVQGKDTCKGDSGGSLMYYDVAGTVPFWYAAGIVSFGAAACGHGLPGVYTNIEHYLEWINENIED